MTREERPPTSGGAPAPTAAPAPTTAYPNELVCEVLLADGRPAEVRPILPSDREALHRLHLSLSKEARYFRFFSIHDDLSEAELDRFVNVDYAERLALVALVEGELVAVARYDSAPGTDSAEVAFTVRDDQQGRGLATVMLEHLASAAVARGIRVFVADTLTDNRKMLGVFRHVGFEEETGFEQGVVRVVMRLDPGIGYLEHVDERDRRSTVRSMESLLRPSSIAVIGASRQPLTVGNGIVVNLVSGGFRGTVYPVNPAGGTIAGLPAYASVGEIPAPVDVAVIAVPAREVPKVVDECGAKGVKGVIIVSAGFAETGIDGAAAERELVGVARRRGMRMIGPNCMGVVNTAPGTSMNATFSPIAPVPGRIAFSSQSGGLGIAILNEASRRGLGVSDFVSVGNKADVSSNDLLCFFEEDPNTEVILLYLESFGNPRKFARIARRVARTKPIVALKSGRSSSGSRGAASHTAALASPDREVDALFHQAGVIRVDTMEELFDVADVLANQPLPKGRRVAIVGNAGGPGVLAADACESHGLAVPELSPETQATLRGFLSPEAAVTNPVDCIASATAEDYARAIETVLADDAIDAAIVIFTPPLVTQVDDVAAAVAGVAEGANKPILANFLATNGSIAALHSGPRRVPWFAYPESAARALGRVVPYAEWRSRPEPSPAALGGIDAEEARDLVEAALALDGGGGRWLNAAEVDRLLACYSIPMLATARASSVEQAVVAASSLGYPVAVKVDAPGVVHKSDAGGVRLGLTSADQVSEASAELLASFGSEAAVVVQPMARPGVEMIAGLVQEQSFGPVVMFGLGGTATEVLGDRSLALVPITSDGALEMIHSLRSAPLLMGYRGQPPVNLDALVDVLCRLGQLAQDLSEVAEIDLNPLLAGESGCAVLDAKVRVAVPVVAPEPALLRRHLR